ncbi:MAG: hypothetical protein CL885_03925 [Dehalococcoidia bacterium]|nr:hypothetical protein [Dehalococcoidia bacterium]
MQKNSKRHNKRTEDIKLIKLIKLSDDQDALKKLADRHSPLFASIVVRLAKRFNNWSIVPELMSEKDYVIYTSAKKYDETRKTKFSTFLGNEAKWAYLNKCNAQKKNNRHLYTDSEILDSICKEQEMPISTYLKKDTFDYIFKILKTHPDDRMKAIFSMRYKVGKSNKVMPWHLVGTKVGLSAQGCINIHKSGIEFIKEKLNKEGIL